MPSATPTILVTGSSGHLGKALMLALPSYGYQAVGIDILPNSTTTEVGSIADRSFVKDVLARHQPEHVIHAAALHKPHVGTHSLAEFVRVNCEGTAVLLEEVVETRKKVLVGTRSVKTVIYISTTSTFGHALAPPPGQPAALITESVAPQPKNIYGVTKTAAEDLCKLVHDKTGLPVIVLRTSRFFPEEDDAKEVLLQQQSSRAAAGLDGKVKGHGHSDDDGRIMMDGDNLKVLELAYRRVDLADLVGACVCAVRKAEEVGWGKYVLSAPSPFLRLGNQQGGGDEDGDDDRGEAENKVLAALGRGEVAQVCELVVPGIEEVFARKGWTFLKRIDRVYDSRRAQRELGWQAEYTFARAVEKVAKGEEWRSELALKVGELGYHAVPTGVYTKRAREDVVSA
ncbi:hypothetical protein VTJ04DRAFT_6014 [Mycothermus thermophilus]|uniref:uncharacterized protein n=1 Tax=Humicola insolens TaxID=85995 RepID=UPI003743BD8E